MHYLFVYKTKFAESKENKENTNQKHIRGFKQPQDVLEITKSPQEIFENRKFVHF